jgi:hypothetical protein
MSIVASIQGISGSLKPAPRTESLGGAIDHGKSGRPVSLDLKSGVEGAYNFSKGGAAVLGTVGCTAGAIATVEFGGVGCLGLGPFLGFWGAVGGGVVGFIEGSTHSKYEHIFDWGPDQIYMGW